MPDKRNWNGVVAVIENCHAESCGVAPKLFSGDYQYFSTFQNQYGEQWVFFRKEDGTCWLRGGDAGWDNVYEVEHGTAQDLVLAKDEAKFVMASWMAATWPRQKGKQGGDDDAG